MDFKLQGEPSYHALNSQFKLDFKNYLPYAYCYRFANDTKGTEQKKLMNLDINLCSDITVFFNEKETLIEDFEYVEYGKNRVYIKIPGNTSSFPIFVGLFPYPSVYLNL
jgi:hypothetical protein